MNNPMKSAGESVRGWLGKANFWATVAGVVVGLPPVCAMVWNLFTSGLVLQNTISTNAPSYNSGPATSEKQAGAEEYAFTFVLKNEASEDFANNVKLRCSNCAIASAREMPSIAGKPLTLRRLDYQTWLISDFFLRSGGTALLNIEATGPEFPDLAIIQPDIHPRFDQTQINWLIIGALSILLIGDIVASFLGYTHLQKCHSELASDHEKHQKGLARKHKEVSELVKSVAADLRKLQERVSTLDETVTETGEELDNFMGKLSSPAKVRKDLIPADIWQVAKDSKKDYMRGLNG